jgi:hypothetical protein
VVGPISVIHYQNLVQPQPSAPDSNKTDVQNDGREQFGNTPQTANNNQNSILSDNAPEDGSDTPSQPSTTQDNTRSSGRLTIDVDKSTYVVDEYVVFNGSIGKAEPHQKVRIDIYDPKGKVFANNLSTETDDNGVYSYSTSS